MHKHKSVPKVLFILRKRFLYPKINYYSSPGLDNSAKFVSDMLNEAGIESKVVSIVDNNVIDREVTQYKPTHVVIEALWVVPPKFEVLMKLHPTVKWIIRVHSDISFMATEGIAFEWLIQYLTYKNVFVAFNKKSTEHAFEKLYKTFGVNLKKKILYLPNYYPQKFTSSSAFSDETTIKIGCFGALRPLKNQLIQALAAVIYAKQTRRKLEYHINGTRLEGNAEGVLKNIRQLFAALDPVRFQLVEHIWLTHDDFMKVVQSMDMGLQVSFSETFNIVSADFVASGVPMVTSSEVTWIHRFFQANTTDVSDILHKMYNAELWKRYLWFIDLNKSNLRHYDVISKTQWLSCIKKL